MPSATRRVGAGLDWSTRGAETGGLQTAKPVRPPATLGRSSGHLRWGGIPAPKCAPQFAQNQPSVHSYTEIAVLHLEMIPISNLEEP
jgi:hypothetical protein